MGNNQQLKSNVIHTQDVTISLNIFKSLYYVSIMHSEYPVSSLQVFESHIEQEAEDFYKNLIKLYGVTDEQ